MKNLFTRFLFIAFALFACKQATAQVPKTFSSDSVKFITEIDDYFSSVKGKEKEGHEFIKEQFKPFWFGGYLNSEKRQFVYKTSISLLQKKLRPFPDFYNFYNSLISFYTKSKLQESSFKSWQASMEKLITTSSAKKLSDFLEASNDVFTSGKLYQSPSVEWFTNSNSFDFQFDSLPKIVFQKIDLFCAVKADTASIANTSGTYYPTEKKWTGTGGKVTWKRAGIDENAVHAELKKYSINTTKASYSADSVTFTNTIYFKTPLKGTLEEKAVPDADVENATYPRFESYSTHFEISNIAEGKVDFSGGFSLRGSKFIGSGNDKADAYLYFKRNNKALVRAAGKTFVFRKDRITSDDVAITMFFDKDTVYHPSIKLKFDIDKKELILIRTMEGISKTPYFNTFHKVDMHIEEIDWKLDSTKMDFKAMASAQGVANFVSMNYYRDKVFSELQGMDQLNPLVALKQCSDKLGRTTITGEEYARFRRAEAQAIRPYLIPIANGGFISYDPKTDKVVLQERLFTYLSAKTGKVDYDVIGIHSEVPGGYNNAVLNLLNYDLKIYGVSQIIVSDSQNVVIYPLRSQVILKKNRDFFFGGVVQAGKFTYFGKDYFFDYDKFKIEINNGDSIMFTVSKFTPDAFGNYPDVKVKSVIEQVHGDIQIDFPSNKSGRISQAKYPIFTSAKESFVYYDKRNIQRGTYKRDKFYFKVDPFVIDSLDNFSTKGFYLKGQLTSAGIFPDFRETLSVQPDYSLGFIRTTGPEGLAAYGGVGKFNNKIRLSNEGLRGEGDINYITSTLSSKDMVFFPDSMNGMAEKFQIKERKTGGTEYPPAKGDSVYVHWMPKKDVMQIYSQISTIDMYDKQAQMKGRIDYSSKAMTGNGVLDFAGATLTADLLKFKNKKVLSDTALFVLKSLEEAKFAFSTKNVNAVIDFEKRTGNFASNGKGTVVDFPVNQYICYMDNFKWNMDKGDIELSSKDASAQKPKDARTLDLSGPEFISTNPKQDSLRFNAPKAKFNFKDYVITAMDVAWIHVADAKIYPDSGKVTILKAAEMKTLTNSKIVANSVTSYHTIQKATTNISGKKSYVSSGYYDYTDEMKTKKQIFFANIKVDTTYQTVADAEINEVDKFMLSPNYEFKGKVHLASNDQFLTFNGYTKITHACPALGDGKTWFAFESQINPEKILIPVTEKLLDEKGKELNTGIMVATDTTGIYTAFMTKQPRKTDKEVLTAKGFLYYDKTSKEYRISSKEKLTEPTLAGNYVVLKTDCCSVSGNGKLGSMGADLGQIKLNAVGTAFHDLRRDSAFFDVMMAIDFFFDNGALDKMSEIITTTDALSPVATGQNYERGLRELIGKDKADKLIAEVNLYGKFKKFPEELEHTLFLNSLKMKWDPTKNAYVSTGNIGIGTILKTQINKSVNGKIALWKKRAGDILDIYLEIDKNNWYYFRYTKGLLTAVAEDPNFNKIIQELKGDKRQLETERGQTPYQFAIGSEQQKNIFLRKLKDNTDE